MPENNGGLPKHVSQSVSASDPTLADRAASEESQALADDAGSASGAQTAQAPDLYARALAKLDEEWRVGSKVPLNVYAGERPVCQCHSVEDARMLATGMNFLRALLLERQAQCSGPFVDFGAQDFAADAALREFAGGPR